MGLESARSRSSAISSGDLADAVRKGRREEFAWAYAKYGDEVPDPLASVDLSIRGARLGRTRRARGAETA